MKLFIYKYMYFKKWLQNEIAIHPSYDSGTRKIILKRLGKIIELGNDRRGDEMKDFAGPRHSMDEVHQDVYEAAWEMQAVLLQHDLTIAWPIINQIYERYKRIVDKKSTQQNDLHSSWEDYRRFYERVSGWIFSIWEMVEDAVKGRHPDENNYTDLK